MLELSTSQTLEQFHQLLKRVDRGESIRIMNHGRARARIVPDCGFMSGAEFARVFEGYQATAADKGVAAEVARNIATLDQEEANALAH